MKRPVVLVTGASGFLGGRLVECLLAEGRYAVRAMARTPGRAVRLARRAIDIVWADLMDQEQVQNAVRGADIVVHCAYGADAVRERDVTVRGTHILAKLARDEGVRRFIHISTIAVFSYTPPPKVTEETPMIRSGDPYCDAKIDAELEVRKTLPDAVILRLGNVYGPFSAPWTVRPLTHIREGKVTLVDNGEADANAVYVDNAVSAIIAAFEAPSATGECFFVTDEPLSWREWYGKYAEWLGLPLRSATREQIRSIIEPGIRDHVVAWKKEIWDGIVLPTVRYAAFRAAVAPRLGPALSSLWARVPPSLRERIVGDPLGRSVPSATQPLVEDAPYPSAGLLSIYAGRTRFDNSKLKNILGWRPRLRFAEAISRTRAWAEWARLIPQQ
ncbi:MAG: NAD-dependent epimerase/dehydratase family protein [Kiritimatiellae bacterium]|nr:NAD-dependent epimerase/dehydratase family protein [Kiritimatiellia bacterium]MDW8458674.1 NAD-dependent epimerase/dehydratase family protein [Verrucomicrobiota bacterium]